MNEKKTWTEQQLDAIDLCLMLAEVCGVSEWQLAGLLTLGEHCGFYPEEAGVAIRAMLISQTEIPVNFNQWFALVYWIDRLWGFALRFFRIPEWRWSWRRRVVSTYGLPLLDRMIESRKASRFWLDEYAGNPPGSEYLRMIEMKKAGKSSVSIREEIE